MRDDYIYLEHFIWSKKKAEANLKKHGVSFEVAARVFNDPILYVEYDKMNSTEEERYNCTGTVDGAITLLRVAITDREPYIRIISARKATRKEAGDYEKNAGIL